MVEYQTFEEAQRNQTAVTYAANDPNNNVTDTKSNNDTKHQTDIDWYQIKQKHGLLLRFYLQKFILSIPPEKKN